MRAPEAGGYGRFPRREAASLGCNSRPVATDFAWTKVTLLLVVVGPTFRIDLVMGSTGRLEPFTSFQIRAFMLMLPRAARGTRDAPAAVALSKMSLADGYWFRW